MIDTILGKHGNQLQNYEISKKLQNYIDYELMQNEGLYTSLEFLKISICLWNLGGVNPITELDIKKWLFPFD